MSDQSFLEIKQEHGITMFFYSYPKRPSWKAYGEGRGVIDIRVEMDGSLCINSKEVPEGQRGMKETYVSLPRQIAVELAKAINVWQPPKLHRCDPGKSTP